MATSLVVEVESGTCSGELHPHNGYYAGDFGRGPVQASSPAAPARVAVAARSALDEVGGRTVDRWDLTHPALLEVLERLQDLGLGVHHERSRPGDGFADRLAA
jgi:hypothetical protein